FFFSSRRRHTRCLSDWSSDVCSSDLIFFDRTVVPLRLEEDPIAVRRPRQLARDRRRREEFARLARHQLRLQRQEIGEYEDHQRRSEERRVGKEGREGWWRVGYKE